MIINWISILHLCIQQFWCLSHLTLQYIHQISITNRLIYTVLATPIPRGRRPSKELTCGGRARWEKGSNTPVNELLTGFIRKGQGSVLSMSVFREPYVLVVIYVGHYSTKGENCRYSRPWSILKRLEISKGIHYIVLLVKCVIIS